MRTTIAIILGTVLTLGAGVPAHASETSVYEDRLNASLQRMLDAVVGPGHAVATTAVELDLDQVSTTTRRYTQDPSVGALSESLSRATSPGYESSTTVRTNALNEVYETRRKAPGGVKKLSVAVVVDQPVDVAQLQQLVSVAAGADPARGDTVVVSVARKQTATTAAVGGTDSTAVRESAWKYLIGLALIVVGLLTFRRLFRRRRVTAVRAPIEPVRAYRVETPEPARPALPPVHDPRTTAAVLREWVK